MRSRLAGRRDGRLELRLTPTEKGLLKYAAAAENKTVSAFVLAKGLESAAEILADRREFRLDTKRYDAFVASLDAPGNPRPRLKKLLAARSVLE